MRFDVSSGVSAQQLLKTTEIEELTRIFADYGEEPAAAAIAAEIIHRRQQGKPVETATELEDVVLRVLRQPRSSSDETRQLVSFRLSGSPSIMSLNMSNGC